MTDTPDVQHTTFNEAETRAIYAIAEWYAECCRRCGKPVPPDAMRAVLSCALTTMMANAAPPRDDDADDDGAHMPDYGTAETRH